MYVAHANSWDVDQREKHAREVETKLLDVILAEFHQLMNEKREAIEALDYYWMEEKDAKTLVPLDDVLSILTEDVLK